MALRGPDLPYPTRRGRQKAPRNPIFAPPNSRGNRPRASRRHTQECAGAPAPAAAASGSRGLASGPDPPPRRDAANRLSWIVRSAVLPLRPLATAELLPARRPARPSRRRNPSSSLVRPPGRGLVGSPSPRSLSLPSVNQVPSPQATRLLFLRSATGASPQPQPQPQPRLQPQPQPPPRLPAESRRARGPRPP